MTEESEKLTSELLHIRAQIRVRKGIITKTLNKLENEQEVSVELLQTVHDKVEDALSKFMSLNDELAVKMAMCSEEDDSIDQVQDMAIDYQHDIIKALLEINSRKDILKEASSLATPTYKEPGHSPFLFKLPELKVEKFENCDSDPFCFSNFSASFNNAITAVGKISDCQKLYFLKSVLKGGALSLVEHIDLSSGGFNEAWSLLEKEFLDKDKIINLTLNSIIDYPNLTKLSEVENFITFLKFKMFELEKLGLPFCTESTGDVLMSLIVRNKLPKFFVIELSRKINSAHPKLSDFLEHSSDIIKMLSCNEIKKQTSAAIKEPKSIESAPIYSHKVHKPNDVVQQSQLSYNYAAKSDNSKFGNSNRSGCKLCFFTNHSTVHCKKYPKFVDRQKRAIELKLCSRCLSKNHLEPDCPGMTKGLPFLCSSCHTSDHVLPMCPKLVSSTIKTPSQ